MQTEADRAAQRCIIASLSKQFPDIAIIGEEGSLEGTDTEESIVTELDKKVLESKCPEALSNVATNQVSI